jgi:adenylate cyclase
MTLGSPTTGAGKKAVKLGFKTSIIALFVAIVLVIGLTLVYLSFERINAVTN